MKSITHTDVIEAMEAKFLNYPEGCACGSGLFPRWFLDARGIELFRGCDKCAPAKLKQYRPEVLTNPNYHADEAIEPEDY